MKYPGMSAWVGAAMVGAAIVGAGLTFSGSPPPTTSDFLTIDWTGGFQIPDFCGGLNG